MMDDEELRKATHHIYVEIPWRTLCRTFTMASTEALTAMAFRAANTNQEGGDA